MDLESFTKNHCLHSTERLAKILARNANQVSDDIVSVVRYLIYIERLVVWESNEMQQVFNNIVNNVGRAIDSNDYSDINEIQVGVIMLVRYIRENNSNVEWATMEEVDFYARKLRRIKKRVEKIHSILESREFDPHTVVAISQRYDELRNMCCNASQWLEEEQPDKNLLKKIFNILESRIDWLENDCTLWDRVVDTVADVFVSSHDRRCFRRSSPAV